MSTKLMIWQCQNLLKTFPVHYFIFFSRLKNLVNTKYGKTLDNSFGTKCTGANIEDLQVYTVDPL